MGGAQAHGRQLRANGRSDCGGSSNPRLAATDAVVDPACAQLDASAEHACLLFLRRPCMGSRPVRPAFPRKRADCSPSARLPDAGGRVDRACQATERGQCGVPLRITGQHAVAGKVGECLQHPPAGCRRSCDPAGTLGQVVLDRVDTVDDSERDGTAGGCSSLLVGGPAARLGAPCRRPPSPWPAPADRIGGTFPAPPPRGRRRVGWWASRRRWGLCECPSAHRRFRTDETRHGSCKRCQP